MKKEEAIKILKDSGYSDREIKTRFKYIQFIDDDKSCEKLIHLQAKQRKEIQLKINQ